MGDQRSGGRSGGDALHAIKARSTSPVPQGSAVR
jgi:hypothetical protein